MRAWNDPVQQAVMRAWNRHFDGPELALVADIARYFFDPR